MEQGTEQTQGEQGKERSRTETSGCVPPDKEEKTDEAKGQTAKQGGRGSLQRREEKKKKIKEKRIFLLTYAPDYDIIMTERERPSKRRTKQ